MAINGHDTALDPEKLSHFQSRTVKFPNIDADELTKFVDGKNQAVSHSVVEPKSDSIKRVVDGPPSFIPNMNDGWGGHPPMDLPEKTFEKILL